MILALQLACRVLVAAAFVLPPAVHASPPMPKSPLGS